MNVLITCADPLTINSRLGESIIEELGFTIKNTVYAGKWPDPYNYLLQLGPDILQKIKKEPQMSRHFDKSVRQSYEKMKPLKHFLPNIDNYNILLDEHCPTIIFNERKLSNEVKTMNSELVKSLQNLKPGSYFITHIDYDKHKNRTHPIANVLNDNYTKIFTKKISKEDWFVYQKKKYFK